MWIKGQEDSVLRDAVGMMKETSGNGLVQCKSCERVCSCLCSATFSFGVLVCVHALASGRTQPDACFMYRTLGLFFLNPVHVLLRVQCLLPDPAMMHVLIGVLVLAFVLSPAGAIVHAPCHCCCSGLCPQSCSQWFIE